MENNGLGARSTDGVVVEDVDVVDEVVDEAMEETTGPGEDGDEG